MRGRLSEQLSAYAKTDVYPFHMPGHKRNDSMPDWNIWAMDLTEIDGFDDLHHADGILKNAMERAAAVFGAEKSYFLVNGSTSGILSALSAALMPGEILLMARNCHKSAYHAVGLRNLKCIYLYPQMLCEFGIYGEIQPKDVERAFQKNLNIKAVFLTSPTYEGITSPIHEIAKIVHAHGAVLIVDEAHGAHFKFHRCFPKPALEGGADLVIQSLHKTLPSLTQTAILHVQGERVDREALNYYLGVYQTSSPSYILMASVDNCVDYLDSEQGKERMRVYVDFLEELRGELNRLIHIQILNPQGYPHEVISNVDISKICMKACGYPLSGKMLYDVLREQYDLQLEMSMGVYALAMTSIMDERKGYWRLRTALKEIDEWIHKAIKGILSVGGQSDFMKVPVNIWCKENDGLSLYKDISQEELTIGKALELRKEEIDIREAPNRISGQFVSVYPPGIPCLVPGERITDAQIRRIIQYQMAGYEVQGVSGKKKDRIYVVKNEKGKCRYE